MTTVVLKPLIHRNQECIGIYFENLQKLNTAISKQAGAKWSQTNKCWYIPQNKESYNKLIRALVGKADIERSALDKYLLEKKKTISPAGPSVPQLKSSEVIKPSLKANTISSQNKAVTHQHPRIYSVNAHIIPAMEQRLKLKAYSSSTIKTYLGEMGQLLILLKNKQADDLTPEELKRYLVYCYDKLKLTENTLHSRINAMKFYYEQVLGREKFFWDIPRPKKPFQLPKLLNEAELTRLFNALTNKKHKAILFTAYSSGLRVSEIVNLKISDIDSGRMQILVERAKGKKDRYVNLSPLVLDILRKYIKEYKPRPKVYLFESEQTQTAYPTRTIQQIFTNAKNKAGIQKSVGIHSLRHYVKF